jgi:hydroxymethylpyrimidine pyrophosphatase-like HAD family hydrolase
MKTGVIIYHNNIETLYDKHWVDKSIKSILNQTDKNFILYELNYNGENKSIIDNNNFKKFFWYEKLQNYAESMNFLLDKAFNDGCDCVFNTNLDDFYSPERFSLQKEMLIENDLDIVSSDFCYIEEKEIDGVKKDVITKYKNIATKYIKENLESGHNVIAHPAVCYNKRFWSDNENRYDINKTPVEDFDLWKRSIKRGYRFGIHKSILLYYRIHKKQSSNR